MPVEFVLTYPGDYTRLAETRKKVEEFFGKKPLQGAIRLGASEQSINDIAQ